MNTSNQVQVLQTKLQSLREEFDRVDANNPHRSLQVARDISEAQMQLKQILSEREPTRVHVERVTPELIRTAPAMLKVLEDLLDRKLLNEPDPPGFDNVLMSVVARARGRA